MVLLEYLSTNGSDYKRINHHELGFKSVVSKLVKIISYQVIV